MSAATAEPTVRATTAGRAALVQVRDEIRRAFHALPFPDRSAAEPARLIVAVSGGADSVCLCDAIAALASELRLAPTVAHLDHGLRGDDARADAAFVRDFAARLGLDVIADRADVQTRARAERVSIEVAARRARYEFLARAAHAAGAARIALAHHADDQAETVLLRLIRGTGLEGLRGMRPVSPHPSTPDLTLIRPLLRLPRADSVAYCAARGLTWRHDASNDEPHHTRNRIRHELLPLLEQYNPGIRKVLARLADTAASDFEIIEHATRQAYVRIQSRENAEPFCFDRSAWRSLPEGLQRAVLRHAARELRGNTIDLKYAGVEEARDVLNSNAATASIALTADLRIAVSPSSFAILKTATRIEDL